MRAQARSSKEQRPVLATPPRARTPSELRAEELRAAQVQVGKDLRLGAGRGALIWHVPRVSGGYAHRKQSHTPNTVLPLHLQTPQRQSDKPL